GRRDRDANSVTGGDEDGVGAPIPHEPGPLTGTQRPARRQADPAAHGPPVKPQRREKDADAEQRKRKQRERPARRIGQKIRHDREERSEEHTSELQSPCNLVCRLLLEKKKHEMSVLHTLLLHHSYPVAAAFCSSIA